MDPMCVQKGLSEFGCSMIGWGLTFVYILFGAALIAAVVLPFISALKNPKVLTKIGISVGVLLVIFLVSYAISGNEVTRIAASKGQDAFDSKMIGAGLITFYIALVVAVLGLVYSEVSKAFR
jgi:uncharacterized membrane protein YeiB